MTALDHDVARETTPAPRASGIVFALASAAAFALSGPLATALIAAGWSPAAAVTIRVWIGAAILAWPAMRAVRGRGHLLRREWRRIVAYGLVAVAGCQLAYFNAVSRLDAGVALLLEYVAPVLVVGWLWARHQQRPSRLTWAGAVTAAAGLACVLGIFDAGADMNAVGVLWGLVAAVCLATYFMLAADRTDLPGVTLAGGGLVVGAAALTVAVLTGLTTWHTASSPGAFRSIDVPWWLLIGLLGAITAALAYVFGIAAARLLGSRLASFVALSEVLLAVLFAWLLLAQRPTPVQVLGGVLVVAGVVLVKRGEPAAG